jgi:hypothetical protein
MRQHLSTSLMSLLAELFHEFIELDGVIATDIIVSQPRVVREEDR